MGGLFSKPPATNEPRDTNRILAASRNVSQIREQLIAFGESIQGQVLIVPKEGDDLLGGEAEAYHKQRERPFYFNDANYPCAIVQVETVEDISKTVKFVRSLPNSALLGEKYALCIAGGCHSNKCMVDNSIVVDLQKLNKVTVNIDKDNESILKTITVQGGAKIHMAHDALRGTGWSLMTGTNGDTGISGLTMAGGGGWLGGQAGYACDTVLSAQCVLPSGDIVTATDDNEYKDLLRALRGGGGNFGIVTEWTFRLFDVSNAFGGTIVHFAPTIESVTKVLKNYANVLEDIPDAAGSIVALPVGAPVFADVLTMIGDEVKEAKSYKEIPFLAKASKLGAWFCMSNDVSRKDYINEIAPMLEPVQQRGFASSVGVMVYSFDESIQNAIIHAARVDLPMKNTSCVLLLSCLNGQMRRDDGSRSSLRHRKAQAWIIIEAAWEPHATAQQKQSALDWADRTKAKLIQLGGEDGPHDFRDSDGRRIKFFTDEQRTFLEQAKKKYDPDNLLTLNKNIVARAMD